MTERDKAQPDAAEAAGVSRREFVTRTAAAGAGLVIVPRHVLGRGFQAPSDTVNIATVGVSGMGFSNTSAVLSQNIAAFCDVDFALVDARIERERKQVAAAAAAGSQQTAPRPGARPRREPTPAQLAANEKRPKINGAETMSRFLDQKVDKVPRYRDYREMLEKQKDIDGVIIATPDHMHATIALAAMDAGKHVYVQKPLCWSVDEARRLAKKAKENPKIVTQMGNQGHSRDEARLGYEYITSGAIGDVREVQVWTNRPLGYWPQGVPRPAPLPARLQDPATANSRWRGPDVDARTAAALLGNYTLPDQLAWDLFLGVAPPVDYHPIYHPFNWRGWVDWGQGALGDMGAHLLDHPFWSLKLGFPNVIETRSTPFNGASYPLATTTYYEFPARGSMPPVRLTWYDGGFTPPKPDEIGDENLNGEGGIIYIGSKGKMMQETYGLNPRLLPDSKNASTPRPKQVLPRIPYEAHEMNWVDTIKGQQEISSPLEYAAQLTEVMLLGIVSLRAGGKIHYDAANRKITNKITSDNNRDGATDPNQFLSRDYRTGWTL